MARNSEKAASMLNRWTMMKLHGGEDESLITRPKDPNEVNRLGLAEKWRKQCLREMDQKIDIIQNPTLGEHRTRDLNDEINNILKELRGWERRIVELNGADYSKTAAKSVMFKNGREFYDIDGYIYFGAARNLPGVKEQYEKYTYKAPRRTRHDLLKAVDADYYGYRGEEEKNLELAEKEQEEKSRKVEIERWKHLKLSKLEEKKKNAEVVGIAASQDDEEEVADDDDLLTVVSKIPTIEEMQKELLERKKKEIIKKFNL